jgi:hypothetical protein
MQSVQKTTLVKNLFRIKLEVKVFKTDNFSLFPVLLEDTPACNFNQIYVPFQSASLRVEKNSPTSRNHQNIVKACILQQLFHNHKFQLSREKCTSSAVSGDITRDRRRITNRG